MTMGMQALSGLGLVYIILIFCRCILKWGDGSCGTDKRPGIGIAQTTGSRQVQADVAQIWDSSAGLMAVIADGIGSANTGKVCAQVAADAILDRYEPYCELNDPIYFFRTSFLEASQRIQRTIGERRGGASTGAVFINRSHLYYAVAGDIRVAVMRGRENVIGILQKNGLGIDKAYTVTSGHGMTADKLSFQTGFFDLCMNLTLDTSHISEQCLW